jgi:hypothetical protein
MENRIKNEKVSDHAYCELYALSASAFVLGFCFRLLPLALSLQLAV